MTRGLVHAGLRCYAASIPRPPERITASGSEPRILVQNVSGIGNALMATPLIAELRRIYPRALIDMVTSPASAQILAGNAHLDTVMVSPDRGDVRPVEYLGLVNTLRKKRYDVAIAAVPTVGFSHGIRSVLARIPLRVVHAYAFKPEDDYTRYYSRVIPWDQTRHDVESNLDLLRAVTTTNVVAGPLQLALPEENTEYANRLLTARGWAGGPLLGFCPGSDAVTAFKRWPITSYAQLGNRLLSEYRDLTLAVLCGPQEQDCAAYLRENLPNERVVFVEDIPLLTYCAALGRCTAVLCADSLPVHVCAALRTPLVALFGPTDPRRTGPWMARAHVLTPPGGAKSLYRVPYARMDEIEPCMRLIETSAVFEAVVKALETPG